MHYDVMLKTRGEGVGVSMLICANTPQKIFPVVTTAVSNSFYEVGLNDAFFFIRRFPELSGCQRACVD
jgi:hypothetical protein